MLASNYLMGPVLLCGFLFYGHLRERLAEGTRGLAATAFGGAILFAVSGAVSSGAQIAIAQHPATLSPSIAHALNLVEHYIAAVALGAGTSVLLFAAGLAILRGGALPAWTGWLGLAFGILALVPLPSIGPIPTAIWTLIASIVMIRRAPAATTAGWTPRSPATKVAG